MVWSMRVRVVVVALIAVVGGVAVLAAIQNAGGGSDSPPTDASATEVQRTPAAASPSPSSATPATPSPRASASAAATGTPARTASPTTPATTAPANATPTAATAATRATTTCPVDQSICSQALRFQKLLVAGDIEGLVSSPRAVLVTCPDRLSAFGPYPLCAGQAGGVQLGHPLARFNGDAGAADRDGLRQRLREWLAGPPGEADKWGPPGVRVASVGCGAPSLTAGTDCRKEVDLVFTRITADGRTSLLLRLTPGDAYANAGITGLVSGDGPDLLFTGGTLATDDGFGYLHPAVKLQPWAPPEVGLP